MYIGQSQDIMDRWSKHLTALKCGKHENKYLQSAYDKYGKDNFQFNVLEYCDVDKLNEREIYYINLYNTLKDGYNLCEGGNGTRGYKHTPEEIEKMIQIQHPDPVVQLTMDLKYIAEFPSASTAGKRLNLTKRGIKACCDRINKQKSIGGYVWMYKKDYELNDPDINSYYLNNNRSMPKPILQYDYFGNFIKRYDSIYRAGIDNNLSISDLTVVVRENSKDKPRRHTLNGYFWKEDNGIPIKKTIYYFEQYDMNWNFIQRFTCLKDFAEQNHLSELSLRGCISGQLLSNFGKRYKKITKEIILP